jgi:hypothetical protein
MNLGVVVGNKSDFKSVAAVDPLQATEFARTRGLQFTECSAQENADTTAPFEQVANELCRQFHDRVEALKYM